MILSQAAMRCGRRANLPQRSCSSIAVAAAAAATTTATSSSSSSTLSAPQTAPRQPHNFTSYYGNRYGDNHRHYFYSTSSLLAEEATTVSTAHLVKQLRESTGAPMMECKKALSSPEVKNDLQLAKEWLRKHGSAKALSKVAGREALEGLVGLHISTNSLGPTAALVKVSSETDFASRSTVFSNFVQEVAIAAATATATTSSSSSINLKDVIIDEPIDVSTFLFNATTTAGKTLHESLNDAILAIRENLSIDAISVLKTSSDNSSQQPSVFGGYVHGKVAPDVMCGTAAAIVELVALPSSKMNDDATIQEAAKKIAMHIVAAKPLYINIESVPEEVVQKEKEILLSKIELEASSGLKKKSSPEIQEKILKGQLRKYYESVCLTEQAHMVEEGNPKVSKVLTQLGVAVKNFRLMSMSKS
jgi:elongation factor Ts